MLFTATPMYIYVYIIIYTTAIACPTSNQQPQLHVREAIQMLHYLAHYFQRHSVLRYAKASQALVLLNMRANSQTYTNNQRNFITYT